MSKSVKFVLDLHGLNDLMKSDWFRDVLAEKADEVTNRGAAMGVTLEHSTHLGSFTGITNVYPADKESALKCAENKLLEKALFGGGAE